MTFAEGSGGPRRSQKEEAMGCIHVKECVSDLKTFKKQKQFKSLEYECQVSCTVCVDVTIRVGYVAIVWNMSQSCGV